MSTSEKQLLFNEIISLVLIKGERFQKKHGNWIRLAIHELPDTWLVMDSWNSNVRVVAGSCTYDNMYTGFTYYVMLERLGMYFGGFECDVDIEVLKKYLNYLKFN